MGGENKKRKEKMNWFILELPKRPNSNIKINEKIKEKINELESNITIIKALLTPH